jgi:murein DD-endopeptidase MepM/ murein hydrolase activator NlpD
VIGRSGNTDYSTGPHLHFELHLDGSPVDPLRYLP